MFLIPCVVWHNVSSSPPRKRATLGVRNSCLSPKGFIRIAANFHKKHSNFIIHHHTLKLMSLSSLHCLYMMFESFIFTSLKCSGKSGPPRCTFTGGTGTPAHSSVKNRGLRAPLIFLVVWRTASSSSLTVRKATSCGVLLLVFFCGFQWHNGFPPTQIWNPFFSRCFGFNSFGHPCHLRIFHVFQTSRGCCCPSSRRSRRGEFMWPGRPNKNPDCGSCGS